MIQYDFVILCQGLYHFTFSAVLVYYVLYVILFVNFFLTNLLLLPSNIFSYVVWFYFVTPMSFKSVPLIFLVVWKIYLEDALVLGCHFIFCFFGPSLFRRYSPYGLPLGLFFVICLCSSHWQPWVVGVVQIKWQ